MRLQKILFWGNKKQREQYIVKFIICELNALKNKHVVYREIYEDQGVNLYADVIDFKPDTIFTYPITTDFQVKNFSIVKLLCRSQIICYTTEGVWDFSDKEQLKLCTGYYNYSPRLIDYHIFWGEKLTKLIGNELYVRGRINNRKRLISMGYPLYEKKKYKELKVFQKKNKELSLLCSKYTKTIMFVTGFHCSTVTKKQVRFLPDVVNQKETNSQVIHEQIEKYWNELVIPFRKYKEKYIENIEKISKSNPEILFMVKMHPLEIAQMKYQKNGEKYSELGKIENVYLIKDDYPIGVYLSYVSLLVHYGSTTGLEAYIYNVPTVQLLPHESNRWLKKYFESTRVIYIDEYEQLNNTCKNGEKHLRIESIEDYLYEAMNYKIGEEYSPSKKIVEFIVKNRKRQLLSYKEVSKLIMDNKVLHKDIMMNFVQYLYQYKLCKAAKCLIYGMVWMTLKIKVLLRRKYNDR